MSDDNYKPSSPIAQLGGAKRKNGHKANCSCHICENMKNKAKRGGYQEDVEKAALKKMGVPVIKSLKQKHISTIQAWLDSDQLIPVNYPDVTEKIIDMVLKNHGSAEISKKAVLGEAIYSVKKFRNKSLGKILHQLVE